MLPSYRNQSTDLHSKSTDWFLYGTLESNWFLREFEINKTCSANQIPLSYMTNVCKILKNMFLLLFDPVARVWIVRKQVENASLLQFLH